MVGLSWWGEGCATASPPWCRGEALFSSPERRNDGPRRLRAAPGLIRQGSCQPQRGLAEEGGKVRVGARPARPGRQAGGRDGRGRSREVDPAGTAVIGEVEEAFEQAL